MRQRSYRASLNLSAGDLTGEGIGLVGILDAILVPGEHGAQLRADGLDALVGVLLLQLLEVRGAGILIVDELLGERASWMRCRWYSMRLRQSSLMTVLT